MGLFFAKLFCKKKMRILMAGLDDGGKKTIFYKLKFGKALRKISTVGFDIETVEYKNVRFTVRNIDARDKVRVLWRPLFQDTQGIIYVVDSINRDRISEARHQLDGILKEHELSDAVLLVFVNKQNLPNAMTIAELTDKLGLNELRRRHWYIQSSCITQGQGFYDGLDWLCSHS